MPPIGGTGKSLTPHRCLNYGTEVWLTVVKAAFVKFANFSWRQYVFAVEK